MQIRINKYISESGLCSRREADKYIEQGAVTIDGKRAETGSQVLPGQVVRVFGEIIEGKSESIIIAYNKPVGIVSTTDPDERDNVVDAICHTERIFPIGRLDKDSQGLLLLTNEGDIVNKILRVNNNHDKEYFVIVDKPITADFIKRMQGGIPILGVVTRKCEITQKGPNAFTIVLRQGLNRQIRRMCEYLGYNVTKLQRTRIMHIQLGNLKIGQYRNLTPAESEILYKKLEKSVKTEEASIRKGKPAGKDQSGKASAGKTPSSKTATDKISAGKGITAKPSSSRQKPTGLARQDGAAKSTTRPGSAPAKKGGSARPVAGNHKSARPSGAVKSSGRNGLSKSTGSSGRSGSMKSAGSTGRSGSPKSTGRNGSAKSTGRNGAPNMKGKTTRKSR